MAKKKNAVRLVLQRGFECNEAFYEYDENDLNGMHAAEALNLPPEQVFKTLVARGAKKGICVFCIPVCCELDLKLAAQAAGDKSIAMLPVKELLDVTGYIRGGCSPIGMKKALPTFVQEDAKELDRISVSAGVRGCQVILAVEALMSCARAEFAALCRE